MTGTAYTFEPSKSRNSATLRTGDLCKVLSPLLFILNHLYSGVQAPGPDRSQTGYSEILVTASWS